jgi:glycosyltransferase involved in cell wall biosynthesis
VSVAFPPGAETGALRPAQLVRRIRGHGFDPCVLTLPRGCRFETEPETQGTLPDDLVVETVPCASPWEHTREWFRARGVRRVALAAARAAAQLLRPALPVDTHYPWAIRAARRGSALVRERAIELVWATGPPFSGHVLARRLHERTGVPYVLDFRDVVRHATGSRAGRRALAEERACLRSASGITFVAPGQERILAEHHPELQALRTRLVHNWFDAEDRTRVAPHRFPVPTVLHGGILYGGARRLDAFFEALARTRRTGDALRFLSLSPPGRDFGYLEALRARHALGDGVRVEPVLPRLAFLGACMGAELLLLPVGRDRGSQVHQDAIPAKLYTYFAACRPILVTGPPGCEAGLLVERLGRGLAAPDDDPAAIAAAIARLRAGQGPRGPLELTLDAVREFEAAHAVPRLAGFLHEVLA